MQSPSFELFGIAHVMVLIATLGIGAASVWLAKNRPAAIQVTSWAFGTLLILAYPLKVWAYQVAVPGSFPPLPMHMCDWAAGLCIGAMWLKRQWMAELAYFWGIGGTLQAVFTPNLAYGFPHLAFFAFFLLHSGVVICVFYVTWGLQMKPRRFAFVRAWAALHVYLVCALIVNGVTGSNYGFLREKPAAGSLFDFLGPWPWYILSLEPFVLFLFALLSLPFLGSFRRGIKEIPDSNV